MCISHSVTRLAQVTYSARALPCSQAPCGSDHIEGRSYDPLIIFFFSERILGDFHG